MCATELEIFHLFLRCYQHARYPDLCLILHVTRRHDALCSFTSAVIVLSLICLCLYAVIYIYYIKRGRWSTDLRKQMGGSVPNSQHSKRLANHFFCEVAAVLFCCSLVGNCFGSFYPNKASLSPKNYNEWYPYLASLRRHIATLFCKVLLSSG